MLVAPRRDRHCRDLFQDALRVDVGDVALHVAVAGAAPRRARHETAHRKRLVLRHDDVVRGGDDELVIGGAGDVGLGTVAEYNGAVPQGLGAMAGRKAVCSAGHVIGASRNGAVRAACDVAQSTPNGA